MIIFKKIFFPGLCIFLFTFFANENLKSQNSVSSDTVKFSEIELDSIRFFIQEDLNNLENTLRDTVVIQIEDKVYLIPYKITARTSVEFRRQNRLFKLTGVSLSKHEELGEYIRELFANPREKLTERISSKNWKKSSVYINYFSAYDQNPKGKESIESGDEFKEFKAGDEDGYVEQNYTTFPLPQTLDIEIDLRASPRTVSILGLEFDFDRLDKRFQKILLEFGNSNEDRNRKTYNIIK